MLLLRKIALLDPPGKLEPSPEHLDRCVRTDLGPVETLARVTYHHFSLRVQGPVLKDGEKLEPGG